MALIVSVQYATARAGLPHSRTLLRWARATVTTSAKRESLLTIRFVSSKEGRALNKRWRARDYATNVLAFPGDTLDRQRRWLGDIVICAPVLRREARQQGKQLKAHCAHLMVHGLLHLLGHDHQRDDDANRMERKEARILAGLGFADPYADEQQLE
jgi:probable rRNA maturation factor